MGISQTKDQTFTILKKQNWGLMSRNRLYSIVKCRQTNIIGQMYLVNVSNFQQQIGIYQYRHNNPDYLVSVHQVSIKSQQLICSSSCTIEVVTQRIPYRLGDLGQIKIQEAFQMIYNILKGAELVYKKYGGGFILDQSMVCINDFGKCKLWVNENLAVNKINQKVYVQQKQFINNIFQLFESRVEVPQQVDRKRYNLNTFFKAFCLVENRIKKYKRKNTNNKMVEQYCPDKQFISSEPTNYCINSRHQNRFQQLETIIPMGMKTIEPAYSIRYSLSKKKKIETSNSKQQKIKQYGKQRQNSEKNLTKYLSQYPNYYQIHKKNQHLLTFGKEDKSQTDIVQFPIRRQNINKSRMFKNQNKKLTPFRFQSKQQNQHKLNTTQTYIPMNTSLPYNHQPLVCKFFKN